MTNTDRGLCVSASPQGHPIDPPFTVTDADVRVVAAAVFDQIAGCGFGQSLRLPPIVPGLPARARDVMAPYVTAADAPEAYFAIRLPSIAARDLYAAAPELWVGGGWSVGEPPPEDVMECLRLYPTLELLAELFWCRDGRWILSTSWVGGTFPAGDDPADVYAALDAKLRTCRLDDDCVFDGRRHWWSYWGGTPDPGCQCSGHWDRAGGRHIDLADPVAHKHGPGWDRPAGDKRDDR